ncbi:MAG: hypothetical protein JWR84_480 [Caulobacter sp.]|nr:hypothetical protein [Caulobacter sp.]
MTTLRSLLLILTAMLFAFGGLARAAEPATSTPPCHEAPADHSSKATLSMSCCVGCMPAPNLLPPPVGAPMVAMLATYVTVSPTLLGRPLAPDTPPPRA